MLEMKDAYSILGVKEGAGKDEIVKRFDILLKKYRASTLEGSDKSKTESELAEINIAYNLLMGYRLEDEYELRKLANEPSKNPILKKFNVNEKKLNNYIYYYKYHAIIGFIMLFVMIFTIRGCMNNVKPDINIAFMGDFFFNEADTNSFENKIKSNMPKLKEIGLEVITLSDKIEGQQAYAMQMKAVTIMAAGDIDVYIMDKANFNKYADKGAFFSLDEVVRETKSISNHKEYKLKAESEKTEHIYGIDIGRSDFLNEESFTGKELIVTIGVKAKHRDEALKLVKLLIN